MPTPTSTENYPYTVVQSVSSVRPFVSTLYISWCDSPLNSSLCVGEGVMTIAWVMTIARKGLKVKVILVIVKRGNAVGLTSILDR